MSPRPKTGRARRLRRDSTAAERALWRGLRSMKLPVKIRRQHPIGRHIVDFAVPARKLAIEIDGGQHATAAHADARRTRQLAAHGYRVIRFWNNDVLGNLEGVLETVRSELGAPHLSPALSAPKGAEREGNGRVWDLRDSLYNGR